MDKTAYVGQVVQTPFPTSPIIRLYTAIRRSLTSALCQADICIIVPNGCLRCTAVMGFACRDIPAEASALKNTDPLWLSPVHVATRLTTQIQDDSTSIGDLLATSNPQTSDAMLSSDAAPTVRLASLSDVRVRGGRLHCRFSGEIARGERQIASAPSLPSNWNDDSVALALQAPAASPQLTTSLSLDSSLTRLNLNCPDNDTCSSSRDGGRMHGGMGYMSTRALHGGGMAHMENRVRGGLLAGCGRDAPLPLPKQTLKPARSLLSFALENLPAPPATISDAPPPAPPPQFTGQLPGNCCHQYSRPAVQPQAVAASCSSSTELPGASPVSSFASFSVYLPKATSPMACTPDGSNTSLSAYLQLCGACPNPSPSFCMAEICSSSPVQFALEGSSSNSSSLAMCTLDSGSPTEADTNITLFPKLASLTVNNCGSLERSIFDTMSPVRRTVVPDVPLKPLPWSTEPSRGYESIMSVVQSGSAKASACGKAAQSPLPSIPSWQCCEQALTYTSTLLEYAECAVQTGDPAQAIRLLRASTMC